MKPDIDDILGTAADYDLTNVDTSFPVLAPGYVDCTVSNITSKPTEKGHGSMLNIELKTSMPWKLKDGVTERPAGFPLTEGIFIPNDRDSKAFPVSMQKLAQFKEAVLGTKAGAFGPVEQYLGKPVTVKLKIEASDEYGDRNRVAAFVKRREH